MVGKRMISKNLFSKEIIKNRTLYAMTIPGLLYIFIMYYIPMFGVLIAFKEFNPMKGIFGSKWIGLKNFEFFFKSNSVFVVTFNTILYNLIFLVVGIGLALIASILLTQLRNKYLVSLYKSVMLLPFLISWVIASYLLFSLLSTDRGIINQILQYFGKNPVEWYSEAWYWRIILPLAYIWKNIGYFSVIFIAAIVGVSPDYYEAAEIDGASKFQQALKITLPLLSPVVITLVLLQAGKIFFANFGDWGMFYTLPNESGMLFSATDVIDTYVFRSIRQMNDFGMSSAIGLYQSVVGCILVLISNYLVKKYDRDSSLF